MAKLRKGVAYRKLERPYTRKSKYKNKQYVRGSPNIKIVRFEHGDKKKDYAWHVQLIAKEGLQIRAEAMESMRQVANRYLEKFVGKSQFFFRFRIYPFHVLRENPLAAGAGADRMSTGMQKAFGKPIGVAAQVKPGKTVAEVYVQEGAELKGKTAMLKCSKKLAGTYRIVLDAHKGPVEKPY
jgi:large subunit ribosomal protein L10e